MPDVWEELCDGERWTIKRYPANQIEAYKRKAGVIAFGEKVTLTVDNGLLEKASEGCKFSNFILAHELGHVALDHHARNLVTKNFQLFSGPNGMMANIPPTLEELEANYAAVFFQCGILLEDILWSASRLAERACSDLLYVTKAQAIVRLEVFQRALHKPSASRGRVVL
ncbi:ImmA/IrrE family metallo-endopeptidase [Cypionkella sinensis]|uniref:M48 family metalloprotease n=1 Tax=Cypionkella sinensis TaxID=1756043 RepID=A0ABV7IWE6_9RHOB